LPALFGSLSKSFCVIVVGKLPTTADDCRLAACAPQIIRDALRTICTDSQADDN